MFAEKRLNPIQSWSQRKSWVLNKVPVYFWLNFKLKREQEIAVESISINQDILTSHVADCIWEELKYYKYMSFQVGNKTSQLQAFLAFSSTKTRLPTKQDHLESSAWLLSRQKLWQTMDITTTCTNCYEKSLQFFQGICAATVQWTNSFLWFLVVEIKNLQRSEQAYILVLWLRCSILLSQLCSAHLCSNVSLRAGSFYTFRHL